MRILVIGGTHFVGRAFVEAAQVRGHELTLLSLKDMESGGLVHREVFDDYPPVTSYSLDRRARPVYRALVPLAEAV